jgi:hypothetical protein
MAQNPIPGVPAFFQTNTAMGLTGEGRTTGGHSKIDSESEADRSHIAFKIIGPIAAGQRGYRQDQPGYVELEADTLAEGQHDAVYIMANHREPVGQALVDAYRNRKVTFSGISAPWQRYNGREMNLAPISPKPRLEEPT